MKMAEISAVDAVASPTKRKGALWAIGVGGFAAGTLDLTQACILFGWDIPLSIAAGLLGRAAIHGGAGTYLLGVCGLFFGAAVEEVMTLVVLPLSALHARGPYHLNELILGLAVHMTVIGLPIAYSVRRFS
jgi:hypothetical protein